MAANTAKSKMSLALKTASEISQKTEDLREIMSKMSDRRREMFKDLIKGKNIVQTAIKYKQMDEVAEKLPTVTNIVGTVIDVKTMKWSDFEDLPAPERGKLSAACRDMIGQDYKNFIIDIKWMLKMMAFDAMKVVASIMEDNSVAPQTRLSAAQDMLNRAGWQGEKETQKESFPVQVHIRYDKEPKSDNPIIEGDYGQSTEGN